MDENETKRKLKPKGQPELDQQSNTPPAPVKVRKPLGKLITLRTRGWVRLKALQGDLTSIILPSNAEAISLALKGLLESVLAETGYGMLAEVLRETKLDLIVTAEVVIPRSGELRLDAEKQLVDIIDELCRHDMAAEARAVQENSYWTIPLANVALALVPCDSDPVDYQTGHLVLETPLREIQKRVEEAQSARLAIDAERKQWLHQQAEPLLDELEAQLQSAEFPTSVQEEIRALREQLRRDAYGYSSLIDTSQLQEQLDISARRAQELAQQGRIGQSISRFYVFSAEEAAHFAEKDRPTGKHRTK